MRRKRILAIGIAALAMSGTASCVSAEQVAELSPAPRDVAAPAILASQPDASEIAYANATAAGIYRRRASQRSADFVAIDQPGYGLCLRSPARTGKGYDHALIVLSQRLDGQPISQVDDDTIVYRRPADTRRCHGEAIDWIDVSTS